MTARTQPHAEIDRKRGEARELHACARRLGLMPGRERDANNVSKEAAILDAEVEQMLCDQAVSNSKASA